MFYHETQKLSDKFDIYWDGGIIQEKIKEIPDYILSNLNPRFILREYQNNALKRFMYYLELYPNRLKPTQLLFNMATGSGKTLLMAANILYLYNQGYRYFLFFVNSSNIIEKTKDNFINPFSPKYLFNERIKFAGNDIVIRELDNFDEANENDINIIFITIQGLHSQLKMFRENSISLEDFEDKKIVLISDEAHHINAWTKNNLTGTESELKSTWEGSVDKIFKSNHENIMLEYTATIDLDNLNIYSKYKDKLIFEYDLKEFRIDGYSKEVKVLEADLNNIDRMLNAVILSQYRRKIAERNKIYLKPVILFKSRNISESKKNYDDFINKINNINATDINKIQFSTKGTVLEKAFDYFKQENINVDNLLTEIREDFFENKCILLDSENITKEKQIKLNTLEEQNNEIRAIFAVKMLDEGWDVLNLFDIVRLYDTRDGKYNKYGKYIPGNTTLAEKQLIGRGARYYPFKINEEDDCFIRKFDKRPDNEIKILEELYYHSANNPKYISELTFSLKESGIMPYETKEVELKIKDTIKNTDFWKYGLIYINKRIKAENSTIKTIEDMDIPKIYNCNLYTEKSKEISVLDENTDKNVNNINYATKNIVLESFSDYIIKKAIAKLDFYKFNNLKKYFPALISSVTLIDSLKKISITIKSSEEKLNNLTSEDKLEICVDVLSQLEKKIIDNYVEYNGTKLFIQQKIQEIFYDKKLKIDIDNMSDAEYGKPMSDPTKTNIFLNLKEKGWYVYNENYGTSEEKFFIKFIDSIFNNLEQFYSEIYLLRNEKSFKIYTFSVGKPIEPDFVLCLKKKDSDEFMHYQLFIEPKGDHLILIDKWKEDFLKEIEIKYQIENNNAFIIENEEYKLIGLSFYNEGKKDTFISEFNEKLGLTIK